MICDNCKQNIATFHQKLIINNVMVEQHLCDECYNFLSNGGSRQKRNIQSVDVCPVCKTARSSIVNSSYLGCPNCYEHFRKQILPNIMTLHGSSKHVGKRIEHIPEREAYINEYKRLLQLLMQAREENNLQAIDHYEQLLAKLTGDDK